MNFDLEKMVNNTRKEMERNSGKQQLDEIDTLCSAIGGLLNLGTGVCEDTNTSLYDGCGIMNNDLLNKIRGKFLDEDYGTQFTSEDVNKMIEKIKKDKEVSEKSKEATKESESLIQNLKDKNEVENKLIHNKENNKTELIPKNTKVIVTDPMFKNGGIEAIVMDYCKGYDKYLCVVDDIQSFYIDKKYIEIVKPKIMEKEFIIRDQIVDEDVKILAKINKSDANSFKLYIDDYKYFAGITLRKPVVLEDIQDTEIKKSYYRYMSDKYRQYAYMLK